MTIQECKENVPFNVKVKLDKTNCILEGEIIGRKNDFATVIVKNNGYLITHEVSWACVSRAKTIGTCILI
jgi:hypothetical protein